MSPHKGAIAKPLSAEEVLDIAGLRSLGSNTATKRETNDGIYNLDQCNSYSLPHKGRSMKRNVMFLDVPDVIRHRMASIRKVDTKPEIVVRKLAHRLGYRFRLHRRDLPGAPDLVFFGRRHKVIFVHGCFWHQHGCKLGRRRPQTRQE